MTVVRSLAIVCLAAAPTLAATSWSTPAGSGTQTTYSGGRSQNGYLTDPTVSGDSFLFTPSNFIAESDGAAASTTDVASLLITAKPGRNLTRVSAGLSGDYSYLGDAVVNATGTLTLTNPLTQAVLSQSFNFGGLTSEDGVFSDNVQIQLPAGWKSAQVDLAAGLTASADDGSTAFVQFKGASLATDTAQAAAVPLPGAVLAAIPGVAVAYWARKRARRA